MNNSSHISLEVLTDIADKRLEQEAVEAAMAHVSTCSDCEDTLIRLRRLIRMMRSDRTEDAPAEILTSTLNIFPQGTPAPLRRIVAKLTFDSRRAPPAFGMRAVHTASRQMLYSAQESDVELRIVVRDEQCIVAGQVLRESCSAGLVEILGTAGSAEASLNELCEFTLPAVPLGNYLLRVKMLDVEIEIPELELTA